MFLPDKLVALDCEMVGVVPERDDLLQIALVKCVLDTSKKVPQYVPKEQLEVFMATKEKPSNEFHHKYLLHVFDQCKADGVTPEEAKKKIEEFLGDWKGNVQPFGDCVPTDMAFLYAKGIINRPDIGDKGQIPGTFHYEFFEQNPLKAVARHKLGEKENLHLTGEHDALQDCLNQLKELNFYLTVLLG